MQFSESSVLQSSKVSLHDDMLQKAVLMNPGVLFCVSESAGNAGKV